VIRVRRARLSDTEGIADVAKAVWGQDILSDVCEAQIEGNASALWVATEEADRRHPADDPQPGTVIGFGSAFLTLGARGHRRWEVDLVAVRQDNQGQGLGTQLIGQVCEAGESHGVSLARALIRVENVASQRAFENAGFTTDGQVHKLLLWGPGRGDDVPRKRHEGKRGGSIYASDVALLPIDTLTYRGLWIEGLTSVCTREQRLALKTARAIVAREQLDNTGALIPLEEASCLATDVREEAIVHGEYHWFVKSVSDRSYVLES
jgi:L-amino acid N-acyltransferase YncA